jgi:uncharacterized SAM-binding protein YcdF (DUF218 family)
MIGESSITGFDANIWWIDFQPLPHAASRLILVLTAAALLNYGVRGRLRRAERIAAIAVISLLLVFTLGNIVQFYLLMGTGRIASGFPLPFSLFITLSLLAILAGLNRDREEGLRPPLRPMLVALGVSLILFPLLQIFCFGTTDYRRPADAAVVFGAKAYANGVPSTALADRVRTACELYHAGLVRTLVFSGGPGVGKVHETESMRRLAVSLGVPDSAIVRDELGLSTHETCENTDRIFRSMGIRRVLAVSNFYHLPRIKMTYQRERREVFTVPARDSYISGTPLQLGREVLALWAYYLGGLWEW